MAHQHMFLVQDQAFDLLSLKDRSNAQEGSEAEVAERLLAKIVDFSHPRTGEVDKRHAAREGPKQRTERAVTL